jgi:hypothetical protein
MGKLNGKKNRKIIRFTKQKGLIGLSPGLFMYVVKLNEKVLFFIIIECVSMHAKLKSIEKIMLKMICDRI